MPVERLVEAILARRRLTGWGAVRAAAAAVAGIDIDVIPPASSPFAAMLRRDWRGAADAFGKVGWSYDRALMLSLLDAEAALEGGARDRLGARSQAADGAGRQTHARARDPGSPRDRGRRGKPAGLIARRL